MSNSHDLMPLLVTQVGGNDQAFPLELKVPNAQTRAAIEESRSMLKARAGRFLSTEALFDDLEKSRPEVNRRGRSAP